MPHLDPIRAARRMALATTFALVALNAWWLWGDLPGPRMKAIAAAIARGHVDEAEAQLRRRLARSPEDGEARLELARLLIRRGNHLDGARQLHEVPFWWPTRGEASFLEGEAFKEAKRARDAEAAWKSCIVDDPLHPLRPEMFHGAVKELVALYILEGRIAEVRAVLLRAFEEATPPEKPGILITRVRAELERIDHKEAVDKLREYLAADPGDLDALRALPLEEHVIGDEASADRSLETLLGAVPGDPIAWRAKLEILNDRGDIEAFREAVGRTPASADVDPRVWLYRGISRQRDGDLPGALEAFRRAEVMAPDDPEVLYKLGMAEQAAGEVEAGRAHSARTRELRQAYTDLREAYKDFLEQYHRAPRDEAGYRSAIERLAKDCRLLGYQAEAEAWLAQLGPA